MKKQLACGVAALLIGGTAAAHTWKVEITNVTPAQSFTPIIAASHYSSISLFEPGQPASEALAAMAEGGDTAPLAAELEAAGNLVGDVTMTEGLLEPGQSVSFEIDGRPGQRLSLAGMLIPTNDTFVAVNSMFLPLRGTKQIEAIAWDAGTEMNDQNCANIPGPRCMGAAYSAPDVTDEGFVHVSNGFHELGYPEVDGEVLQPAHYDWNNPVALITIRRMR